MNSTCKCIVIKHNDSSTTKTINVSNKYLKFFKVINTTNETIDLSKYDVTDKTIELIKEYIDNYLDLNEYNKFENNYLMDFLNDDMNDDMNDFSNDNTIIITNDEKIFFKNIYQKSKKNFVNLANSCDKLQFRYLQHKILKFMANEILYGKSSTEITKLLMFEEENEKIPKEWQWTCTWD